MDWGKATPCAHSAASVSGDDSTVLRWGVAVAVVVVAATGAIEIAYATGFAGEGSSSG
jgi:hypothetical protein